MSDVENQMDKIQPTTNCLKDKKEKTIYEIILNKICSFCMPILLLIICEILIILPIYYVLHY